MISSLGGASPTTPAFTFVNPQDPTAPLPSNGLFTAAGTEVSAQEVNDDPGDDVGGGILTTSGVKGTLQTYSATATLISSKLDNSEGEFYGTAVLGYVDHIQAQTQETWTNAKDVYNSRGQVVGAFGLENGAYVVEDAQGTQDMTSLLESSGESWTQQRAAMAQQSVDGADWNGSSDLQSIEATLAQFTLLQGEKGEAASATTDVYDANGNYVASFAEVWQQGSGGLFDSITATGGADEIERPLSGAGIDFATQDAVIQQQTQPTIALMNSLDTIVNTAGTMLLDQNRKHPWYAMQDSYGTAVAPGATISPIYDANGNYVGSTGIDPATGVAAQWDGDGNITLDAPPATPLSSWTQSQIQGFTPAVIAQITPTQMGGLSATQLGWFSPQQTAIWSSAQVAGINPSQIGGITANDLMAISPQAIAGLTAAQMNNMSSSQLAEMTSGQVSQIAPSVISGIDVQHMSDIRGLDGLSAAQVAQINVAAIPNLNAYGFGVISPAAFAGFSATQINNMTASQLAAATSEQVAQISPSVVAGIDVQHMDEIRGLDGLSAAQVAQINVAAIPGLNSYGFGVISPEAFAGFSAAQINTMTSEQLASMTSEQVSQISPSVIGGIDVQHMDEIRGLDGMSAAQVAQINVNAIPGLNSYGFSVISPAAFVGLSAAQINNMSSSQLTEITSSQISQILPFVIGALNDAQIAALGGTQVSALTGEQVAGLSNEQLSALTTPLTYSQVTSALQVTFDARTFIDSSGNLVNSSSLQALFDSDGTYLGAVGIDPDSGLSAIWDVAGNESTLTATTQAVVDAGNSSDMPHKIIFPEPVTESQGGDAIFLDDPTDLNYTNPNDDLFYTIEQDAQGSSQGNSTFGDFSSNLSNAIVANLNNYQFTPSEANAVYLALSDDDNIVDSNTAQLQSQTAAIYNGSSGFDLSGGQIVDDTASSDASIDALNALQASANVGNSFAAYYSNLMVQGGIYMATTAGGVFHVPHPFIQQYNGPNSVGTPIEGGPISPDTGQQDDGIGALLGNDYLEPTVYGDDSLLSPNNYSLVKLTGITQAQLDTATQEVKLYYELNPTNYNIFQGNQCGTYLNAIFQVLGYTSTQIAVLSAYMNATGAISNQAPLPFGWVGLAKGNNTPGFQVIVNNGSTTIRG